jgi:hypothetical protein
MREQQPMGVVAQRGADMPPCAVIVRGAWRPRAIG